MKYYKKFDVCIGIEGMSMFCFARNHTRWSYLREEFIIFQNIFLSDMKELFINVFQNNIPCFQLYSMQFMHLYNCSLQHLIFTTINIVQLNIKCQKLLCNCILSEISDYNEKIKICLTFYENYILKILSNCIQKYLVDADRNMFSLLPTNNQNIGHHYLYYDLH